MIGCSLLTVTLFTQNRMVFKAYRALVLFAATLYVAAAAVGKAHAATFECGKPGAPCGASLPSGVQCPGGPGNCDPGYFCGWRFSNTDRSTRCMPVPKGCGQDGQSCCPGNDVKPITNATATPKPYCRDGSYCFYTPTPDASGWSSPPYSSPAGNLLGTCHKVPKDCGTAIGKPCCPSQYHTGVNPPFPVPSMNSICSGNLFCQYSTPNSTLFNPNWPTGTCLPNKPDCGKFGKSCCISTTGVSTDSLCGARWNQPGQQGYCAYLGGQVTGDMRDQICLTCPSKNIVAANPANYFPCPSQ